jgi:hypothetical protein
VATERAELAQRLEAERLGRPAVQHAHDVLGRLTPFALGELSRRGAGLAVVGVDDPSAVADRPRRLDAGEPHVRLGAQPAALLGGGQPLQDGGHRGPDRTDDRGPGDDAPVLQPDPVGRRERDAGLEDQIDPGRLHLGASELTQLGADLGQELVPRVDERDPDVVGGDVAEAAAAALD